LKAEDAKTVRSTKKKEKRTGDSKVGGPEPFGKGGSCENGQLYRRGEPQERVLNSTGVRAKRGKAGGGAPVSRGKKKRREKKKKGSTVYTKNLGDFWFKRGVKKGTRAQAHKSPLGGRGRKQCNGHK